MVMKIIDTVKFKAENPSINKSAELALWCPSGGLSDKPKKVLKNLVKLHKKAFKESEKDNSSFRVQAVPLSYDTVELTISIEVYDPALS